MPLQEDRIDDFSGGVNDLFSADRILLNESAEWLNMEYRDRILRTRRGSSTIIPHDSSITTFQGGGSFRNTLGDAVDETLIYIAGNKIFAVPFPLARIQLATPDTILTEHRFWLVQGLDYIYLFRGWHRDPWRWNPALLPKNTIEVVPRSTTGTNSRMPGATVGVYHLNRFFLCTGPQEISISDALDINFDLVQMSFNVGEGDNDSILAIEVFSADAIIVGKQHSMWAISNLNSLTTDASVLVVEKLDSRFGIASRYGFARVGNDLWYLSANGVMTVAENEEQKLRSLEVPLSEPIAKTFAKTNKSFMHLASVAYYDNYFIAALADNENTEPNFMIVFDFLLRKWIGTWKITSLNIGQLIRCRCNGMDKLFILSDQGGVFDFLNRQDDKDFVQTNYVGLEQTFVDFDEVWNETNFSTDSSGIVELRCKYFADDPSGGISLITHDILNAERFVIETLNSFANPGNTLIRFKLRTSAALQWQYEYLIPHIQIGNVFHIVCYHDGTEPKFMVDGTHLTNPSSKTETDKTKWMPDITDFDDLFIQVTSTTVLLSCTFSELTGSPATSGRNALYAHFPLNEGSGTTVTASNDATIQGTSGGATWVNDTSPADETVITSKVVTRSMGPNDNQKLFLFADVEYVYKNPQLDFTGITLDQTKALVTNKTYDETKYTIAGKADWVTSNVNLDHDDPFRENYSPLTISSATPVNFSNAAGITLGKESERKHRIPIQMAGKHMQLQIDNDQGSYGIKNITVFYKEVGNTRFR